MMPNQQAFIYKCFFDHFLLIIINEIFNLVNRHAMNVIYNCFSDFLFTNFGT